MKPLQKIVQLVLLLSCFQTAHALTLSKDAEISILTCSPGNELYSVFGHTAIRINDKGNRFDRVFNYGMFDFATPHFYLKYAQGLLPYQLGINSFDHFVYNYEMEGRSVYSQTLQLDSIQKQQLLDFLVDNYKPENRSYLYNFLFDNCSTRVRDIIAGSVSGEVQWKTTDAHKSFWNLLDEYLQYMPWVKWGIHTILGQPGSEIATPWQYMFLPDYLMYGLDSAYYGGQKLAGNIETVYQAPELTVHNPWYASPLFVFTMAVLALILLLQYFRNVILLNSVSFLFFMITGLLGALIIFLGFFTAHPITAPNLNLIWANPLNLVVAFTFFASKLPRLAQWYLLFYIAVLSIGIIAWLFATPAVPLASLPLLIWMIYLCFRQKGKINKFRIR